VANRSVWLERLVVAAVLLLTVWGINSYGIWEPWELGPAEAARSLSEAGSRGAAQTSLSTKLIGTAFSLFGVREWSGRLPGVLGGLLTCWLLFALLRSAHSRRAGIIGVVVLATTPAFLLNVRLAMGSGIEMAAQSWVGVAAMGALAPQGAGARRAASYALLGAGATVSTLASGVLLGPLPPVLAVAAWSLLTEDGGRVSGVARWLFPAAAVAASLGVARAVALDAPEPSVWLGGGAQGGNPPTYDGAVELLFHGLAPWSAALPIAAVWALVPRAGRSDGAQTVASVLFLWSAFCFASWTLFASRYGTPPFLALLPLSGLVAIWMAELAEEPAARWPAAVIVALLMGLLVRDYSLYPESPLRALGIGDLAIPDVYDPKRCWALLLTVAGATLSLFLISHEGVARPRPRRVLRWFRIQWESGWAARLWMLLGGWLLAISVFFGLMSLTIDLSVASIMIRAGRIAFFIPFALAALIFGVPWLRYGYGKLGAAGVFPVLGAGLAIGTFLVVSFQPELSRHFSPKPLYDAYAELTGGREEPLAVYRADPAAARYYARAPVDTIESQSELLAFLGRGGPRWVVIEAEQLAELDRAYRRETGQHLFVADAQSARLLLARSMPVQGRPNANFLEATVLSEPPAMQHRVEASYEDRIALLGYDLILPAGDSVGAGQSFEVTWYWRALDDPPAGYKAFVHIDGQGVRLNGDHVPVGGRYPTKLWSRGDVIVDTQQLVVPANFPRGEYVMYVGWFRADRRLEVRSGPQDGANRVEAGTLQVR
jgi:hypothetical protein